MLYGIYTVSNGSSYSVGALHMSRNGQIMFMCGVTASLYHIGLHHKYAGLTLNLGINNASGYH